MYSKERVLQMANYSGDLLTATISFGVNQKWQTTLTIVPKPPKKLTEELKKTVKKIERYDFEIEYQNTKNLLALILSSKLGIVNNRNIKLINRYNKDELNNLKESLNLILDDNYGKIYNIKKEEIDSITSAYTTMNINQINYGKFRHPNQNTEENQEQSTEESVLDLVSTKLEEIAEELREIIEKNDNTAKNYIKIANDIFLIDTLNKEIKRLSVEEDKIIPFIAINNILKSLQIITRNHIPESLSKITMPIQINVKTFITKKDESKPTLLIERNFILPKLILSKLQESLTIYNTFKEKSELIRLDYEDKSILIEHDPKNQRTKFTVLGKKKATSIELKDRGIDLIYNSIINAVANNYSNNGVIIGTGESEEDAEFYKNTIQIYEKSEISDKPYVIYFEKYKVEMSKEELLEFAMYINNGQSINQI
jgi:hypothetical protein